jgi:hypothetical protein
MRSKHLAAAILAAAMVVAYAVTDARAVTFNVTGTNFSGDALTGTLEGDAALTTVTAINLVVSGPGPIPDGPVTFLIDYVSPHLQAVDPSNTLGLHIYLSGPTPSEIDALILVTSCADSPPCADTLNLLRPSWFPAVATAAEVPLPAALPLFATCLGFLGLLGWRRRRTA